MEGVDFLFVCVLAVTVLCRIVQDFWLVCYILLATAVYILIKRRTKQNAIKMQGDGYGVVITGCDTGFGHVTALRLDSLGFTVFAGCLQPNGDGAIKLKETGSANLHVLALNITSDSSVKEVLEYVESHCPRQGLLAVVNNAAINAMGDVELMSMEKYKEVADVNLYGMVRVTKAFAPLIRKYRGRFVNITSVKGRLAVSLDSAYGMIKYAGEAFSDILRREMGRFGVKVAIIEPGDYGGLTGMGSEVSLQRMENDINNFWDMASPNVKQAYGRNYIDALVRGVREGGHTHAPTVDPVVNAIEDAIRNEHPKARYLIDGSDKMLDRYCVCARLNPFLPESVMDFLMTRWFPLPPVQGGI